MKIEAIRIPQLASNIRREESRAPAPRPSNKKDGSFDQILKECLKK